MIQLNIFKNLSNKICIHISTEGGDTALESKQNGRVTCQARPK